MKYIQVENAFSLHNVMCDALARRCMCEVLGMPAIAMKWKVVLAQKSQSLARREHRAFIDVVIAI